MKSNIMNHAKAKGVAIWREASGNILEALPTPPSALAVIAEAPEPISEMLIELGYGVKPIRIGGNSEWVQQPNSIKDGLLSINIPADSAGLDVVIFVGFSNHVHSLTLFEQAYEVLADNGLLILCGGKKVSTPLRLPLWLDYLVAAGARGGFALESSTDVDSGFMRVFRKVDPPRWRLSHVKRKDVEEIGTLFHTVFGQKLSFDLWEWKYGDGRGNAVVVRKNGNIVAHYGGMYRDILIEGKKDWAFQICDVMVHPKERGVLTRQGPFFLAAASCAEMYGPLGYGFPNRRAMQVAEKMGLYTEAGRMVEVRWSRGAAHPRLGTRLLRIGKHASESEVCLINDLWAQMAASLKNAVLGVRDWTYLSQRYLTHPHHEYEVIVIVGRFSRRAIGAFVLKRHDQACELMDVVAPISKLTTIIDQARRITAQWGLPYLFCWVTEQFAQGFKVADAEIHEIDIAVPTSSWTKSEKAEGLKGKWWLMSGDTDFL